MGKGLRPDYYCRDVYAITPQLLLRLGIRGVILDIDNTLVYYGVHTPTEQNRVWLRALAQAGLQIAFVSNGYRERVEQYNAEFGYHMSHKSGKPSPRGFLSASAFMELLPSQVAVVGDQIYTDILGGNRAGMTTFLVTPIRQEPWLRFRLKRWLERPITSRLTYHKEEQSDDR